MEGKSFKLLSWDHRTDYFSLEEHKAFYVVQLSDLFRANQNSKQVVKSSVKIHLKCRLVRGIDHFSRKSVPVSGHPLCKEVHLLCQ